MKSHIEFSPITVQAIAIEVEATELRGKIVTDFVDALPGALIYIGNVVESTELVKSATAVVALAVLRNEIELEPLSVASGPSFVNSATGAFVDIQFGGFRALECCGGFDLLNGSSIKELHSNKLVGRPATRVRGSADRALS